EHLAEEAARETRREEVTPGRGVTARRLARPVAAAYLPLLHGPQTRALRRRVARTAHARGLCRAPRARYRAPAHRLLRRHEREGHVHLRRVPQPPLRVGGEVRFRHGLALLHAAGDA